MTPKVAQAWRPDGRRPFVLGHRGARHAYPENTLGAFQLALDEGADGVELDVRLDGEGDVIVLHDTDLRRVTEWRDCRAAEALTRRDFEQIDVGRGERVPRLADVLSWAAEHATKVNVELKHDVSSRKHLVDAVARTIRAAPNGSALLLSSFHPAIVFALRRALPELPVGLLFHDGQWIGKHAPSVRLLRSHAVHPQRTLLTERRVAKWKARGLLINVWTVNDPAEAVRFAALGVDTLISDNPGVLAKAL